MRLNKSQGPMTVRAAGLHTILLSWGGHNWSATDSEMKILSQDIIRLLKAKGLTYQPEIPD